MKIFQAVAILVALSACPRPTPPPPSSTSSTHVALTNKGPAVTVYASFGADSKILPADWSSFCSATGTLTCTISIGTTTTDLPTSGRYLNVTLSAGAPVGCGTTKAELNVNNPSWYDTYDVSLVDGYNAAMQIDFTPIGGAKTTLGPVIGKTGNEKLLGVFPYGCDICTARQSPPCGIAPGTDGCKAGTQYDPKPPCQFQGPVKGGGGSVEVILPLVPL